MKLMTQKVIKSLPALYSQEDVKDPICKLKFFTPDSSWTWYIIEGQKQEDGDWVFLSKVVSHLCPEGELGYVTLAQLKEVRGSFGMPIERDMYWDDTPLSECVR